jgi:hypothetical protein
MRRRAVILIAVCGAGVLTYFLLGPVSSESVRTGRRFRTTTRTTRWGLAGYRVTSTQTSVPRDEHAPAAGQAVVRQPGPSGTFSEYNPALWKASVAAVGLLWVLVLVGAFIVWRRKQT